MGITAQTSQCQKSNAPSLNKGRDQLVLQSVIRDYWLGAMKGGWPQWLSSKTSRKRKPRLNQLMQVYVENNKRK